MMLVATVCSKPIICQAADPQTGTASPGIVPDLRLILPVLFISKGHANCDSAYIHSSISSTNRPDTNVITSETPYSKYATKGRNGSIWTPEDSIHSDGVLPLALCLLLNVSDTRRELGAVSDFPMGFAEIGLFMQLSMFMHEPLWLFASELELAWATCEAKDRHRAFGWNLSCDTEGTLSPSLYLCGNERRGQLCKWSRNKQQLDFQKSVNAQSTQISPSLSCSGLSPM